MDWAMRIEPTPEIWEAFECIGFTPLPTTLFLPAAFSPIPSPALSGKRLLPNK
jgi:hypothetical protein